ncbi:hypothetical protein [Xanthomonas rydalmerensis]|uniref:Transcriptional regulator n=1 Tax=Xanthomonas rydalmerensis TaxID=3046274 RepID=A0ABZ0JLM9_9XANT|nr:hypothetical protein [Xanthomonas sp. DM-2023]WOS40706.1 hypothetical protein QN243_20310 [Xanthomonas sp. DM-2023]WOS44890.1 hypothetical protein QN242_20310 [Xanthomonas sp. DM-2023]WOS49070.1 hypothetical protein QN240_20310 [Xanthomonas sp. DM-2023]WOS53250.1 hypothetical protein QN244_20315 [Xanthomonas sp. DM-2023]WOS57433.1 hypothetical protein QN245_20310 [Xanthomonas sp. DM-2023]
MSNETSIDVGTIAAMARDAEWLNADACAFILGLTTRKGTVNRRAFLERVAVRPSFPKPMSIGAKKLWKRSDVVLWAEDESRIRRAS